MKGAQWEGGDKYMWDEHEASVCVWGVMNTAGVAVGATPLLSFVPLPLSPIFFFKILYYLNIFTYFCVHLILYLEYFNDK